MRILVFGAGSLGRLVAGVLSGEAEVILHGRGLTTGSVQYTIIGPAGQVVEVVAEAPGATGGQVDLALLVVKSPDTARAGSALRERIGTATPVISVQNGLGNLEILTGLGFKDLGALVTTHGAKLLPSGDVEHAGGGPSYLGGFTGKVPVVDCASLMSAGGIAVEVVGDIHRELWRKAAINAAINPLTAVARITNGALLESPYLERFIKVGEELASLLSAAGFDDLAATIGDRARKVAEATSSNHSSMLQDREQGRPLEYPAILGPLLAATPVPHQVAPNLLVLLRQLAGIDERNRFPCLLGSWEGGRWTPGPGGERIDNRLFTTLRTRAGQIPDLASHQDRLARGAAVLRFPGHADLVDQIRAAIAAGDGQEDVRLRVVWTADGGQSIQLFALPEQALLTRYGIAISLLTARRTPLTDPDLKIGGRADIAAAKAELAGLQAADPALYEGIMVNPAGVLCEGTRSNVWWVVDGALHTPALATGCLRGVRRDLLLDLARAAEIRVLEVAAAPAVLAAASEILITNAVSDILPVVRLGDQVVGDGVPGPITQRLQGLLRAWLDRPRPPTFSTPVK